MPTIQLVNTQQVIQMGTHVEKVQQTLQQQQGISAQQLQLDQTEADDAKRHQVKEPEETHQSGTTNADAKGKKGRLRSKAKTSSSELEEEGVEEPLPIVIENHHGGRINLRA
jgi:hypothetical protein